MTTLKRRHFIKQSALAAAAFSVAPALSFAGKPKPNLSFSTLGCPKWDLPTIINFAAKHGYNGVELRVIAGSVDLPGYPDFAPDKLAATKRMIRDKNLSIVDIGTSSHMHLTEQAALQKSLKEAKQFIELAHNLDCPYIRVFPEKLLPGNAKQTSLDTIIENLKTLGDFAKDSGVKVLIETHGDLVYADDIVYVMNGAAANNTGLVWDIVNMWWITKEPPTEVFKKLQAHIHHVHVKDAKPVDGNEQYVLLGKGKAPIREAVKALSGGGYKGFYSFEWEKQWHPELEEPEVALPPYPAEIKKYFS